MGASKTFQYTHEQNKLARTAKALGHSARITIVEHLVKKTGLLQMKPL